MQALRTPLAWKERENLEPLILLPPPFTCCNSWHAIACGAHAVVSLYKPDEGPFCWGSKVLLLCEVSLATSPLIWTTMEMFCGSIRQIPRSTSKAASTYFPLGEILQHTTKVSNPTFHWKEAGLRENNGPAQQPLPLGCPLRCFPTDRP